MNHPVPPILMLGLPGTTTDDVRAWAERVTSASPIRSGRASDTLPIDLEITGEPTLGVELSFVQGGNRLLTLTLFAELATDAELAEIEGDAGPLDGVEI